MVGIASVEDVEELLAFFSDSTIRSIPLWVEDDNCVQSSLCHA